MHRIVVGLSIALLFGCSKPEQQAAADGADAGMAAGAGAAMSLDQVAGTWTIVARSAETDSLLITYQLTATADPAGWTFTLPGGDALPYQAVTADGDSLVLEAGPFPSALREGAQVTTRSVLRLENGELVGTTVAHYTPATADSVVSGTLHGTRVP